MSGLFYRTRQRANAERLVGGGLFFRNLTDDDRDIVWSARTYGEIHEGGARLFDASLAKGGLNSGSRNWVRKPIRAQQDAVARLGFECKEGRLHRTPGIGLQDEGLLWVGRNIFCSQLALIHQGLHIGIVLGDLLELAIAQQISARIAHMANTKGGAIEQHRGQRRAHALGLWVGGDVLADGLIGVIGSSRKECLRVLLTRILIQDFEVVDHELGGDLTRGMPAHAIGQNQQVGSGVSGVLIISADKPAVRLGKKV